jgi:O-acetyl-ADP-ribose deacetylase (regulator of RNase III)
MECFKSLVSGLSGEKENIVAIPKIGCGLAGGDWNIVEQLINDTVGDDLEIWVYELEEKKYSKRNDLG